MPAEIVRLRIANMRKAVLVTGQAYQDPKDAFNEFVSNAADEYAEAERSGARITIHLRRRGRGALIAVSDDGRGLTPDRLRGIARNLFESRKSGDDRTLGEKAIGILAFQQLGGRCEIVSRAEGSEESYCLRLRRGEATAQLAVERRRSRLVPGTSVYIGDLDPEVLRVLTLRKVVDYLRLRRGAALSSGDYEIEVVEGGSSVLVVPEAPEGIRVDLAPRHTFWGRIEFSLWVARPAQEHRRRVAVVGRAGTTIVDDIAGIEDFACAPWTSGSVAGSIAFAALQQTAGRRAVLRDRDAFPVFLDAVKGIEPVVRVAVEQVARDVDIATSERLVDAIRRAFARALRDLEDIANPMRTPLGDEPGDGALLAAATQPPVLPDDVVSAARADAGEHDLVLGDDPADRPLRMPDPAAGSARPTHHSARLPSLAADPTPGAARSRFDPEHGLVLYNDTHQDYLLVKDDEASLLDYLMQLVVKEYVVFNNPRAGSAEVCEEMVRMLTRVRRYVPAAAAGLVRRRRALRQSLAGARA